MSALDVGPDGTVRRTDGSVLLDDRSDPPVRQVIGRLLASAHHADFALTWIRLGTLDLSEEEVSGPERCRVLLGRLDAVTLLDTAGAASPKTALPRLRGWLASGRLEVRSAGLGAWTPDFSVYRCAAGATCLLGAHYFGSPQLTVGPSFTLVTSAPAAAETLAARFVELWDRAHDVAPAIAAVLDRAIGEEHGERVGA